MKPKSVVDNFVARTMTNLQTICHNAADINTNTTALWIIIDFPLYTTNSDLANDLFQVNSQTKQMTKVNIQRKSL
jgi:hypothetical protein